VSERAITLAEHYLDIGRPADAQRVIAELGSPPNERAWLVFAESLRQLDRPEEAAEAAQRGLAESPYSPGLLDALCLAEQDRGDVAAGERAIRSALELAPDDPWLLARYGELLIRAGKPDHAWRVLGAAERLAPTAPEVARLRIAWAYVSQGHAAAAGAGAALLALEPEDTVAHRSLAVGALGRGDMSAARRHMAEVVRADPADAEAADVARLVRIESHWLFAPLWPFRRFGPLRVHLVVWAFAILMGGLAPAVGVTILLAYMVLVAYSWLAPPVIRAVLRRRSR
jgi:tetratricopeptide (TPR) repeat protein